MELNEKEMDKIRDINENVSAALDDWANVCLKADADDWSYHLDYTNDDLMNATIIFNHVLMNIGIKNGTIDLSNAENFGYGLRNFVIDATSFDPHTFKTDLENGK